MEKQRMAKTKVGLGELFQGLGTDDHPEVFFVVLLLSALIKEK